MSLITTKQRVYFAAVGVLALWVGIWCYFIPGKSDTGIPWVIPTLCATFLGSMYLSGTVFMLNCILSQRWAQVRAIMPMIAIWTGTLTIVSLFYLGVFDFARIQVWVWFGAYIIYPVIALGLLWHHRAEANDHRVGDSILPKWGKRYLVVQGVGLTTLSLALLFAPEPMQRLWPWKTGLLMLQLYSGPFLSYGLGSLILARERSWSEIRAAMIALLAFAVAELAASSYYHTLFDGPALSIALWFGVLAITVSVLLVLSVLALKFAAVSESVRSGSTSSPQAIPE